MDDSDRSRDEPSDPVDDSVADDGTVDSGDDGADSAESDADAGSGDEGSTTVESEVTAEVTPEVTTGDGEEDLDDIEDDGDDEPGPDDIEDDGDDEPGPDDIEDDGDDEPGPDDIEAAAGDGGATATVDDESFEGIEGPETDEEMPLAAHIEEMMRRLAVVFAIGGLATLVVVTESTELINYFWSYHIPEPVENRPRLYGPLELPLTRLKVAGLAGVVVGLPAFVYQTYRFMKPGLYENERRYYLAAVPTSLVLGGIGIAFAHFLVLPAIFSYFTTYSADAATIAFGLAETFNLIVIMLAFMAIVFQIPLFIMLAIMMNLVTRQWLEAKRLIFWGAFLGIAFLFSPDPTGMAPIIVTLTMIVLYEGTLAILRWTGN
ncbi:Sec-independent periplasmic protein translocase [Halorubrum aidingense JCM 13560]|uniref:Sec-independent protein translocase protein TatC n=1 Tax=Halorubrum aidingense JCM 13560 TaxID=1230454 RepID=M0P7P5_9EURY|nr:twin-arginine translocase subunit TatC [Halorubrum aidingense]EMA66026.1 Sec-independent periplasmic protein translocase [Halorubrum aidingense JCM 13560]